MKQVSCVLLEVTEPAAKSVYHCLPLLINKSDFLCPGHTNLSLFFVQFFAHKIDETNCNDIKMAGIKVFSCFVVNELLMGFSWLAGVIICPMKLTGSQTSWTIKIL